MRKCPVEFCDCCGDDGLRRSSKWSSGRRFFLQHCIVFGNIVNNNNNNNNNNNKKNNFIIIGLLPYVQGALQSYKQH